MAATTLSLAGAAAILAVAGGLLGQILAAWASLLCSVALGVPGLYFLAYARHLRGRDIALAHAGRFARDRGTVDFNDLAAELHVSRDDAEKILRIAIREGHASGTIDDRGRFVSSEGASEESR